jgi:DNA (cytosine-5)-methyltransferase 1
VSAYYNEHDPYAAAWLRELIAAKHICEGVVDERSIEDVTPDDLKGFTQCHFFAGIGVWSYALRSAGWPDDRPVWTGSCPCQPFSAAGKGDGFADERHLWPAFYHLIAQCRPAEILGEQVASKAVDPWIDLVHADLEALGYAFGCVPFPSAGVGAPHIRDRAYWVANADNSRLQRRRAGEAGNGRNAARIESERLCDALRMADVSGSGWREECAYAGGVTSGNRTQGLTAGLVHGSGAGGMADNLLQQRPNRQSGVCNVNDAGGWIEGAATASGLRSDSGLANTFGGFHESGSPRADQRAVAGSNGALQAERANPGPTNGLWADADWLFCRDGKWRPVEPGTFPLAHGAPARVGRLRGYGNAINAKAAQAFIESVMAA